MLTTGKPVRITSLSPTDDYTGYEEGARTKIHMQAVEGLADLPPPPAFSNSHPLAQFPFLLPLIKRLLEQPGLQHCICYVQARVNEDLEAVANEVLNHLALPADTPAFACLCYASSSTHNYGAMIIGNEAVS